MSKELFDECRNAGCNTPTIGRFCSECEATNRFTYPDENGLRHVIWVDKWNNDCVSVDGYDYNYCGNCGRIGHLEEEC